MLSIVGGLELPGGIPRARYGEESRSDRGRFVGRSELDSERNKGTVDRGLGEGGRCGSGAKVGLVASAIVARVSIVEFDRPWPDRWCELPSAGGFRLWLEGRWSPSRLVARVMPRSVQDERNSVVDGVMGSTARRGGDGVRYCGGRSPRGGKKDAAVIIFANSDGAKFCAKRGRGTEVRRDALAAGGCKAGMLDHTD